MGPYLPKEEATRLSADEAVYELTAMLMHTGTSANAGHYTARLLDQASRSAYTPPLPSH